MPPSKAIVVRSKSVPNTASNTPTPVKVRTENPPPPPRQGPVREVKSPESSPQQRVRTRPSYSPPSVPSGSGSPDTIIVCTMVMIGSALVKDVAHGSPSVKPIVTGMMLGGALLILQTFAPTVAKLLAITGLIGALMTNGSALISVGTKIQ